MNTDMIKIDDLHYNAYRTEILKGIDLSVQAGEFIALVGPNGAGKTTLLRHINGLLKPASGTVTVNGLDTRKARTSELARTVGFLFQNPDHQIISNRLRDEIRFGLKYTGVPHAQWDERIREAAGSVGLEGLLDSDPFMLSRPLRQRLALASVLALRPRVLVLDEPTSAQDERGATVVMDIARSLNEQGVTIILVSHDMELVARYATRAVGLVDGRVAFDGSVHDLFSDDETLDLAGLTKPGAYRMIEALGIDIDMSLTVTPYSVALSIEKIFSEVRV
jgi:energy-coupling factor transport system ATP-binding protein